MVSSKVHWKSILGWLGRKLLALLGSSVVVALVMGGLTLLDGTSSEAGMVLLMAGMVAPFYGFIPALLVTGVSDWVAPRFGQFRKRVAFGIHLMGGVLFVLFAGPYLGFAGVLAAVVFWFLDERLGPARGAGLSHRPHLY